MNEWEHRIERLGGLLRSRGIHGLVDRTVERRSREGWELTSLDRNWLTNRYTLVFKRPRQQTPLLSEVA
jgi:hypothetical protein